MACALMLRRSALDAVGLFDEGFFMYSEETDLERRLARAGHAVAWTPAMTVVHHQGRSTAAVPERRVNEEWRGRHRYWVKHHSPTGRRIAALALGAPVRAARRSSARCCCGCRRGCGRYRWRRPIPPSGGSARGTRCSACAGPASRSSRPSSTAVARLQVRTRQQRDRAEPLLVVAGADLLRVRDRGRGAADRRPPRRASRRSSAPPPSATVGADVARQGWSAHPPRRSSARPSSAARRPRVRNPRAPASRCRTPRSRPRRAGSPSPAGRAARRADAGQQRQRRRPGVAVVLEEAPVRRHREHRQHDATASAQATRRSTRRNPSTASTSVATSTSGPASQANHAADHHGGCW